MQCEKTFTPFSKKTLRCSLECTHEWHKDKKKKATQEKLTSHECALCSKEFVPNKMQPNAKYCSAKCREQSDNIGRHTKNCEFCDKEFHPVRGTAKFCSPLCGKKSKLLLESNFVEAKCVICGKPFEQSVKGFKQETCSNECRGDLISIRRGKTAKTKQCVICDKEFYPPNYHSHTKTCSSECFSSLLKGNWEKRERKPKAFPLCELCGKTVKDRRNKYCSRICSRKAGSHLKFKQIKSTMYQRRKKKIY